MNGPGILPFPRPYGNDYDGDFPKHYYQ
ncbi:hypothetical protein EXIGUO9Y_110106 [Exiguobacterium oxidotolerans]|uniref:Uncharacterized protein n=1 Tax=Exiguobacterium oxidotolerans TaxID=223958 RepID=A0A653I320_9BACL|nr:hypothetical protein EXIGUO9Y_110106 [Exiguobacterium oxidotolerans]